MKLFRALFAFPFLTAQCRLTTGVYTIANRNLYLYITEEKSDQYARIGRLWTASSTTWSTFETRSNFTRTSG